jgi:hypothetical protein
MRKSYVVLLIFSIIFFCGNLLAAEKGAQIEIQQKNGRAVKGELITVKENSLLIVDSVSGADVSVLIADIRYITILKKSKALLWGGIGSAAGIGIGALSGVIAHGGEQWFGSQAEWAMYGAATGAVIGLIGGIAVGAIMGSDKTFDMDEQTQSEIKKTMKYLQGIARISDFQ